MVQWMIRFIWLSTFAALTSIFLFFFAVKCNLGQLFGKLPSYALLENPTTALASELYSADGVLLGKYFRDNRTNVTYQEISPNVINCLIATEDYRFEKHVGIDLSGLVRVLIYSILLRRNAGGGSTLSQQLAKNLFKTRTQKYAGHLSHVPFLQTLIVKVKEWIVAIQLESAYTKKEIITMYLNTVDFGSNAFGIQVAAKTYFNKTAAVLTIEEAALLVGMLKGPTRYSPILNPKYALQRRNIVLYQLKKYQYISSKKYKQLYQKPIQLSYKVDNQNQGIATYFRAVIRSFLLTWAKKNHFDLFEDGLKIYTTIDSRMQQHAETAVQTHMQQLQYKFFKHWQGKNPWIDEQEREIPYFIQTSIKKTDWYQALAQQYAYDPDALKKYLHTPQKKMLFDWQAPFEAIQTPVEAYQHHKKFLHTGFMAMDVKTGHIKAWVGGINFKYFQYDHVIQGKRQPGSVFKPIVYAAAIDNGYEPYYKAVDAPVTFHLQDHLPPWTPKNANGKYSGKRMTLRQAMSRSVNSITAYLIQQIGAHTVADYAKRLGITSPIDPVPALCLGASDVSVYDMVSVYNTFVNQGVWTKPLYITKIEDKYGNTLEEFTPVCKEVISSSTAKKMIYMLKGTTEEIGGTARGINKKLKEDNDIGGKTGTSSNQSDGWFIGITKNLTAGVWVGGEDRCIRFKTLAEGQGAVMARPIWEKFMLKIYEDESIPYHKERFD